MLHVYCLLLLTILNNKHKRRTATETAAFIWVLHYNDQSSFHLENDFWDEVGGELKLTIRRT